MVKQMGKKLRKKAVEKKNAYAKGKRNSELARDETFRRLKAIAARITMSGNISGKGLPPAKPGVKV